MDGVPEFGRYRDETADEAIDDIVPTEPPPPAVGQDERRMQVRAYNFWASLLGSGQFPPVEALLNGPAPAFADNAVLLHFDRGIENPAIASLGRALSAECEVAADGLQRLSDVPGRSLLSRITDHYLQIIANGAPIGFEAEFVNQRGRTILYRGILLPFTSDGEAIDYIYGVINWKELADQAETDALLDEIGAALSSPASRIAADDGDAEQQVANPLSVWADGPARDEDLLDLADFGAEIVGPAFAGAEAEDFEPVAYAEPQSLEDLLAVARSLAMLAVASEDRTRGALYDAIGRAWDFALAALDAPEDFARIVADAGLTMQERAPLTPLVKLVFGADYDKTRLTEFATALGHARRIGLGRGALGPYLAQAPGGLKGVVALERSLRREETGKARRPSADAVLEDLRALPARPLASLPEDGGEFALVLVRRLAGGDLALLGDLTDDTPLFERAARRLVG